MFNGDILLYVHSFGCLFHFVKQALYGWTMRHKLLLEFYLNFYDPWKEKSVKFSDENRALMKNMVLKI